MTKTLSRRQLREQAFQALLSMEFGTELLQAARFAHVHDDEELDAQGEHLDLPVFLLNLVQGVTSHKSELDEQLADKLKAGWTLERLTMVDKTILRLGLFEISYFEETPAKVAVNEAVELAKTFSDPQAARFINGVLTQFVSEEAENN
ncbi:transcription antitermination factor NusB [Streptococcus merionis]|uniref:Transcription antitermination protein NusB n=1 Tax=Streptococcus merionis TaxID=400065 RepID=A0A239SMK3_9STRE|nr:transcription antitermination factor NusB [Streptococcus merionis]SNU86462.1 transcription antitermination protein NusB [Streptococcus merionis]